MAKMSTTFSIEYHLHKGKIVIYLDVRRFYSILGCYNLLTLHILVNLIRLHWVKKALLAMRNLSNVWSLNQFIHQVLNAYSMAACKYNASWPRCASVA